MAVHIRCEDAKALLATIEAHLATKKPETWAINTSTRQITHTPDQWKDQAYFKGTAHKDNDIVTFAFTVGTITGKDAKTRDQVYPHYHGRFVSFLFDHFHGQFKRVIADADAVPASAPAPLRGVPVRRSV
jgi:hypothetical protein